MESIHVATLIIGVLLAVFIALTFSLRTTKGKPDRYGQSAAPTAAIIMAVTSGVLGIIFLIFLWMGIGPQYRLWQASIEKQIMVEDAKARADSAVELARAEVERARGTAEANLIVADSITEPYLRYLYIIQLGNTDNQIVYLPTEAGLPILESHRFRDNAEGR